MLTRFINTHYADVTWTGHHGHQSLQQTRSKTMRPLAQGVCVCRGALRFPLALEGVAVAGHVD